MMKIVPTSKIGVAKINKLELMDTYNRHYKKN